MTDFSDKPTLTGDLVVLRPADGRDAPRLHVLMGDAEVTRLTGSAHSSEEPTSSAWPVEQLVELYDRWSRAEDRVVWVVVEGATGQVVGEVLLMDHDPGNRACGFRIWISGARDRGLGTEATRLAVGHAFDTLGLHRVQLEVYAFNPRARRVYEKVGFVHEGTQREALLFDGAWVDLHLMGMLDQEWRAARSG
jgi:RimJ/RimL family protein N-acetyltransferase